MKLLKYYTITKEQYENTEYRPDTEVCEIETEEGWNYKDIIENGIADDFECIDPVADAADLTVWKVVFPNHIEYVVELKED